MLVSDLIVKIFLNVKGKDPSKAPVSGDKNWKKYLSKVNDKLRAWASDSEYVWDSLMAIDIALLKNGGFYKIPENYCRAVRVYIISPDGSRSAYEVIAAKDRFKKSGAYITGNSPAELRFTEDVLVQDDDSVKLDYVAFPEEVKSASDQVYCDNYEWLAYAVAAEIVRTDPQMSEEFPNLIGMARDEYAKMAETAQKFGTDEIVLNYLEMI